MRALFLLLCVCAAGCSGLTECKPGTCPVGEHCVFVGAATSPKCTPACDSADAGSCGAGLQCTCAASCQGCKNCVEVCAP